MNRSIYKSIYYKLSLAGLVVWTLVGSVAHAQDKKVLIGAGFGTGDFFAGNAPFPIHVFIEKTLRPNLTGGVFLSYGTESYEERYGSYYDRYTWSSFRVAARANYEFNELLQLNNDKLQVYGGAMLGFRYGRLRNDDNYSGVSGTVSTLGTIGGSGFFSGIHVGGRYLLTQQLGLYAELGRSVSWLKLGVVKTL